MVMEGRAPLGEEHDTGTLDDDGDGDGRACTLAITAPKEDCKPQGAVRMGFHSDTFYLCLL